MPTNAPTPGTKIAKTGFLAAAKEVLARRGTTFWSLCALTGDVLVLGSGIHFDNPARAASMALGVGVAALLWAWGDHGDDKPEGHILKRSLAHVRNTIRRLTDSRFARQGKMQKLGFGLDVGTGTLMMLAGLDLTHHRQALAGEDYRPLEIVYGGLIAMAFMALTRENSFPAKEDARRTGDSAAHMAYQNDVRGLASSLFAPHIAAQLAIGIVNHDPYAMAAGTIEVLGLGYLRASDTLQGMMHRDNARRLASFLFAPCGAAQLAVGVLNRDPLSLASGIVQSLGGVCLWSSTRLQRQLMTQQP